MLQQQRNYTAAREKEQRACFRGIAPILTHVYPRIVLYSESRGVKRADYIYMYILLYQRTRRLSISLRAKANTFAHVCASILRNDRVRVHLMQRFSSDDDDDDLERVVNRMRVGIIHLLALLILYESRRDVIDSSARKLLVFTG